jgi:hypothetical protein
MKAFPRPREQAIKKRTKSTLTPNRTRRLNKKKSIANL